MRTKILSTGSYLPAKRLTNHEISERLDTSDEWIVERTGICARHIAEAQETASTMATAAAKQALEAAGVAASELDLIIVATCTPDRVFPSTACLVQAQLGAPTCPAFDISAACAGFSYALSVADQFIRSGQARRALVIGAELMSRVVDWQNRNTCILFGDGAGAVLLGPAEQAGILSTHLHADGRQDEILYVPNCQVNPPAEKTASSFMHMQGNEVFKVAVSYLSDIIKETLEANQLAPEAIDWFIPHQANLRIIKALAKKMRMGLDKVIVTVDQHANTSAASIPLALDTAVRDGRIQRGDLLLLESFGGGITWGSALIRY